MSTPRTAPRTTRKVSKRSKRKRLSPKERETLIVDAAIDFFAEHGFEGTTRLLADRLGITQPLLYRYFRNKRELVERVYEEVYVRRWDAKWDRLIKDRDRGLNERLVDFYQQYARAIYDYVWVRIFIYSGLMGVDINDRYLAIIKKRVLRPICIEMRHENNLPSPREVPITEQELELAWGMHGMFFYRALRHFVYGLPLVKDADKAIENDVRVFMRGAPLVLKDIVERNAD